MIFVFCGHGKHDNKDGTTRVPEGSTFKTYLANHLSMANVVGQVVESGEKTKLKPAQTYKAGDVIPNYRLYPPDGLAIAKPVREVKFELVQVKANKSEGTKLSEYFRSDLFKNAELRWAACR